MNFTVSVLLTVVAAVCLAIALLVSVSVVDSNFDAWLSGGLLSFVLAHLPWRT